jgi:hypothetical protein
MRLTRTQREKALGCDIHVIAQRKIAGKWENIPGEFLEDRAYRRFGFLANVRNYSAVPPISKPRGLPDDYATDDEDCGKLLDTHSNSWLPLAELLGFDYDKVVENGCISGMIWEIEWSGSQAGEPGESEVTTIRKFLGSGFFDELEKLKTVGAERIVFGFDS